MFVKIMIFSEGPHVREGACLILIFQRCAACFVKKLA